MRAYRGVRVAGCFLLALGVFLVAAISPTTAQQKRDGAPGEWRFLHGSTYGNRYSPLDQITAENFKTLETAWVWRGDNFGPTVDNTLRSTPLYIDGMLYTVAGPRRTVAAIDPASGETVWIYREPNTTRYERGMRNSYGKGLSFGEVNGRGVIFYSSPAFFLHAIDAKSGEHVQNWGAPVPIAGFPKTGVIDLLPDLVRDWEPWTKSGLKYDAEKGIPRELGNLSTSSPPIVVNGVVVVGNVHEQGYMQTRIENIPGDILAYDTRSGKHLWKFHVIPRPGEFGHETWENDAWKTTGDVSSWAPMTADPELGLVYFVTNAPTIDFYGGFRPGDNLFGDSIVALDVKTGRRKWHFQMTHHPIWNFDPPSPPILMDVRIDGKPRKIVAEASKNGMLYVWDRVTGEPIWPMPERPVPQSTVPGEKLAATQPFTTKPEPFEPQGLPEDMIIDFTPALRAEAMKLLEQRQWNLGQYNPPIQKDHPSGKLTFVSCPSAGSNVHYPPAADPETGIYYVPSMYFCRAEQLVPGKEMDDANSPLTTGKTLSQFVVGNRGGLTGPQGLPITKPPYGKLSAIDMNTGEYLFRVVNGVTPDRIKNHPALKGLDIPNTGAQSGPLVLVTKTLLITGEGEGGRPLLHAHDKKTGAILASVKLPAQNEYGIMTYLHQGHQYIVAQVANNDFPGSLVALRQPLPKKPTTSSPGR